VPVNAQFVVIVGVSCANNVLVDGFVSHNVCVMSLLMSLLYVVFVAGVE